MKISVIIPTFNRSSDLLIALKSVLKQSFNDYEIIIIDDFSTDGTEKEIKKFRSNQKIKYFKNKKNFGVSVSKNIGIKNAKGKYYWFLDSDIKIYNKSTMDFLYKYLENNKKVGSIGCEEVLNGNKRNYRQHFFLKNDKIFCKNEKIKDLSVDYLATCNCFSRSELVKKIGGFNCNYFYGYEDAELGKKIINLGFKNIMDTRGSVLHLRSIKTRTANYKMFFKNRIRFVIWNYPLIYLFILPFVDMFNGIEGLIRSKNMKKSEIRGQAISPLIGKYGFIGMVIEYLVGLIYGYIWNLLNIKKTFSLKK